MKVFSDERLLSLGIINGTVSREAGNARDLQTVDKIFTSLGILPQKILGLKQTHGTQIVPMLDDNDFLSYQIKKEHIADGWLLARPQTGVMILTADCLPLFIWDEQGKTVSLTHCGWRGIAAKLPQKAAYLVKERAGTNAKLQAFIGPHIGPCCFEVKEDVAGQFPQNCVIKRDGKLFVDLGAAVILQLAECGVAREEIQGACSCQCTCCNKEDFFSYRREGTKDAMLSFCYHL